MDKVILLRYGELYLKGKNRNFFERLLMDSIKARLKDVPCSLYFGRGRYVVSDYPPQEEADIIARLKTVFGLQSMSVAVRTHNDFGRIAETAKSVCRSHGTFRVNVNRADKSFPMTSMELARELGGVLLDAFDGLEVDLHDPDFSVNVDLREDGHAYVYADKIAGAGGMPTGSAGKGLLMLSGGIDSPVAGYMMAKRGLTLDAVHFHSYPYTSELAKEKVIGLARRLFVYCPPVRLVCVPFTEIQENVHKYCNDDYMVTIIRRFMMEIAERVALSRGCGCLINGESLGQVASQTLESIYVTNEAVKTLPVFRPCIGMDKQEIVETARRIGTYEQSILPYEDCCTVFLPENPVTRPSLDRARAEQARIPDAAGLVDKAFENIEVIDIEV